jgi:putative addiction module component (TIGR02574 family)
MARDPFQDIHPPFDDRYTDKEWAAELARRIEEVDSGKVEMISWEEARQRIREAGERELRRNREKN